MSFLINTRRVGTVLIIDLIIIYDLKPGNTRQVNQSMSFIYTLTSPLDTPHPYTLDTQPTHSTLQPPHPINFDTLAYPLDTPASTTLYT